MPHDTPLITTIVAALVLAFIFGAIANRLKMPPLVGYLVAGVCVGPHSPGFVADQTLASQLAEIGVILLMFGVGLNFSLKDLLSVRAIAIPGALIRMAAATALGVGLAQLMGWPLLGGIVFGLALAVSSTVVTLKALQDRHLVDSDRGHIAMGWLIVEDLAMVLALVLIPAFAGAAGGQAGAATAHASQPDAFVALAEQLLHRHLDLWAVIGLTLVKLLAFVGFMVVVGRRLIPLMLHATAHTGSRELFRLAVLAVALGVAAGAAYFFGVSLALGAFFAGMILSESELSHRAAQETLPLRDAFGVLFFVSVGMLFDPSIILRDPLPVLATLAIILVGKSFIGFVLLLIFRRPMAAALQISAALAQIGEFSFILVALGVSLAVLPEEGRDLVLAGAIISIVLNPLAFWVAERMRPRAEARPSKRSEPELGPVVPDSIDEAPGAAAAESGGVLEEAAHPTRLSNHVVLIGYGRVGGVVAGELLEEGAPFVLIEDAEGRVHAAREAGIEVIVGNAATRATLMLANVTGARCIVIAIPNAFEAGQAVEQCRKLNSAVRIIARAHADEEVEYLGKLGADEVIMGEREIGLGMVDWLNGQGTAKNRRDAASGPKLAGGSNVLQQVREAQSDEPLRSPGPPMDLEALEPETGMAIVPPPRSLRRVEPIIATPTGAQSPGRIGASARQALPEPIAPKDAEPAPSVAAPEPTAESSLVLLAGGPILRPPVVPAPEFAEPAPVPPAAGAGEPAAAEVIALGPAPEAPTGAASSAASTPDTEPETLVPLPPDESAPLMRRASDEFTQPRGPESATPASPATFSSMAIPPEEPAMPAEQTTILAPAPNVILVPAPEADAPTAPLSAAEPMQQEYAPAVDEGTARSGSGFRVVPASEIVILPPEPPSWGTGEPEAAPAAPVFRSEFWGEPVGDEPGAFSDAPPPLQLQDVQQAEAARAVVEEGSWLEALERDLFGEGSDDPTVTPPRREAPPPTPQPIETPRPVEDPVPPSQPIETPMPSEVPTPGQPAPPPGGPPTRAAEEDEGEVIDAFGRREPRF